MHKNIPRLPLNGNFDLTYRCNNNCRHCWLRLPPNARDRQKELSFEEIRGIIDQARAMGCQTWFISGGEPMLRPDFSEIFDYITGNSLFYSLNTNGTLITPKIAQLMKRNGRKMVAIYGATSEVHDFITRTPGSFEATMRGFAYLQEAEVFFTVQIIPMSSNFHQYEAMLKLAQSLSKDYRIGSAWLYLSANRSKSCNQDIIEQRLEPIEVVSLDLPNPSTFIYKDFLQISQPQEERTHSPVTLDDCLFSNCINEGKKFHIDPYGGMSFCTFVKDPELRFNLRHFSFSQVWDELIPSIKNKIHGGTEYKENCGSCDLRQDCHWCSVYSYLEHGRYSAKIDYLCKIAQETHKYKGRLELNHKRFFQIAGVTIMFCTDTPITEKTFSQALNKFEVDKPGEDTISIRVIPSIPPLSELKLGSEFHRRPPWAIFRQKDSWVYLSINDDNILENTNLIAIFNDDHSRATIFNEKFTEKLEHFPSLTTFTTDQILLARVLADRQACYIHSSAMVINGHGFLFVGHSDAGKSTIMKLLRGQGEILGDDRIIVRRWADGFHIHGTWNHGELPDVSPAGAPLRAILFLEQAQTNELIPIRDKQEKLGKILSHVVKGLITEDWWDKILELSGQIINEIPTYRLKFDKSGNVIKVLSDLYD